MFQFSVENYGYRFLGCYQEDSAARAMPQKISDFRSLSNKDVVDLCYLDALKGGYQAFGVQYGGQCFSGPQAHLTYKRYGGSGGCRHGKGGTWANDVYFIDGENFFVSSELGRHLLMSLLIFRFISITVILSFILDSAALSVT